jgi:hypothetical protein
VHLPTEALTQLQTTLAYMVGHVAILLWDAQGHDPEKTRKDYPDTSVLAEAMLVAAKEYVAGLEKAARKGDQAKIPAVSTTSAAPPSPDANLPKGGDYLL